jgi:hypothetical protein
MTLILIIAIIWGASALVRMSKERKRQEEAQRRAAEVERMRSEWREEQKRSAERTRAMIELQREQERQRKEQEKMEKEQEKQAEILRKHEERLMKLEQRMATAESELAFNREQRERLFSLLNIEELERDASIPGGKEWQKHQKKVISLENQIHTVQKRIDKAHMDKAYCEKQMEVA